MALPFDGMLVIDCAQYVAAPAAAMILSDFGATVIKVEPMEGDNFRYLSPAGESFLFDLEGRGRRSIAVDLRSPAGSKIIRQLVSKADIFICNTPEGGRKRLGIDSDTLLALNPRLIYAAVSAYGDIGPDAGKPGFDATAYWARSGLQAMVKPDADGPPATSLAAMGDHPTALALYAAIATGLFLREKTGKGRVVSTSLLANGIWSFGSVLQGKLDGADIQPPKPRHAPALPTFNSYKCGCGRWINLSILNEKLLKPACEILGCPEAADDPRFSTYDARRENAEAMVKIFDPLFAKFDRDDLMKKFDAAGVTYGLIATIDDVATDKQLYAAGIVTPFADGKSYTIGTPVEIGGVKKRAPTRAPGLGEHTREVLKELGYSDKEVDEMIKSNAVGVGGLNAGPVPKL